jgi:hypothetical protein
MPSIAREPVLATTFTAEHSMLSNVSPSRAKCASNGRCQESKRSSMDPVTRVFDSLTFAKPSFMPVSDSFARATHLTDPQSSAPVAYADESLTRVIESMTSVHK